MNLETKELLALGDDEEWNKFYKLYEAHIKRIITNRIADKNYVDDLVNEIFAIIYNNMERFDVDYPVENWISRITVFHCINHHRKQKSVSKCFSNFNYIDLNDVVVKDTYNIENQLIDKENLQIIKRSFNEFSISEKRILIYRIFKGYKYSEIEKELDINMSTVKNVIRKHKKNFKIILN